MKFRHYLEGLHAPTPPVMCERTDRLVNLLERAFEAAEKIRLTRQVGATMHIELRIGESRISIAQPAEGWPAHSLLARLAVPDSDAVFARALEAGATEVTPMTDRVRGGREGRIVDPFGNVWTIATMRKEGMPSVRENARQVCVSPSVELRKWEL